jgi:DNA-binding transcriptional regulator GbsR (MarR family)
MGAYSNQKLSALLKQLHDDKIVNKFTDKKKTYFYVGEVANI